ncbi:MAG: DUF11 domain-containing protein [Saprospiraceae bacterium]|nr:DUF11 domain-containing protein [Saprospiraceae bacterium]
MKSLNFFVILLCISLCTTKLLGNPWNTNYVGNPQIRLTKTAGTVTPRGGNVFSVEWTVVIQNTGDENNVEVTSWDDDFQLANAGSPMLIDFTKCKINSMTGTANGVAITMADANPLWNGSSTNKKLMATNLSVTPLILDISEKITVKIFTQFTLALSTTIFNGTDVTARWLNNGNYQPVPVVKNISDAGGLPTAPPLGTVTKSLVCYTLDPATDEHTLVYKLRVRNTGLIPLSEITLQDDLKNQIQGNVNVLSSEIVSTKVFNSTSGLAVADSTRYGLGNNGVFTGWNSNTANIYDTEVLTPEGTTSPDLLVGESIEIVIRFVVKIAQTFVNSASVRWIDQNHCALLNNRATLSIPSNSSLAIATLQTYVCPLEITKTAVGGLTVLEIDTILGNRYSANWNFTLNKAPDLQINNISVKDNFEQSNPSPEAVEVLTSSITATSGFYILDAWDAETPYTSNDVLLTPNDYITNPNIGLDWLAGPYTESTGKYYNINVTYNISFRYLFGTDPSATNTVPPASASICNKVEFSGDIINCNSDSIRITKMSQACVTLPSAPPQATVSKSLQCYTIDPLTDEHVLVYNVRVRNTGLIPLSGINLQDDIKNQIQGNINILSSEIISTKVINSTNGLAVLDSLRYGLGNNGVFTGWNSNTSNLFDTEVLIPSGTVAPILNIGESIDIILRFKVKIVQTFSNGSSIKWIDQNHCVLLNNKATLGIPLNPALSSASLSSYVCPISLVKTPFGAATVVSLDPVLGNTYSATWMIELNKSPDLAINNISLKDNFNLSNPFPEAIEILSTSYSNFEGFNPTDSWNGKTLYSATDIQTTPNEFMVNPNRGIDWQAGTVFTTNQLYSLMRFRAVTTFRYLYGTDPTAINTVLPELASICNHLELKGDIKACSDSIPLFISKDTCISLPVVPQMATMTNILKCYTIDQSSDIHTFRYNLRVTNTGLIPLSSINLQYNLENQIQGDINVLSSQIISTRVVTTSSGIGVSDSLRFGLGNNGVFTGWNSNSTNIFDTEVLASSGSSTPDLKVGESIDILIQFKVKIIQTFLNSASIRWIDQNHCVLLNGRAVLTSPLNPNLSTAQTPTYLCPIVAKKSLLGNISVVELDPVLGNKYLANWNVTFNKPPDLIISDISIRDNFELSNPFPEAVEMLSTTYGPYTGFFVRDEWDGESTYNSSNTMTTPNDYITNPNRGLDWLSGSAFETTGKFYKIDQTFTTNFREKEARFTGTIAGCGDIPDQPIFISAKASVSPINVVPPGNSFVKQFKNLACNLDGSVTANYDLRFINTSNSGGLTQNYTYADFNITDNFDSVIAQNNYPFILSSASVISASKNGIPQTVNSGFNASSSAIIFANNLTLVPNDTAYASIAITFFPNGFNPTDFYLNEARADFSIQGFPNSGTYVTTIAGSVLGNACAGVNIVENVANVQCNSNSTANDPTDDYITFTAMPTGLSGSYTITVPNGVTITPATGTFGVLTNFRLHNGSANDINYALTIVPMSNPCCSKSFTVQSQNCCIISASATPLLQSVCVGTQLANFSVTSYPNYKYTWYGPLMDTLNLGIAISGQTTSIYLPSLSISSTAGIKYFAVVVEDMMNPTCIKDTVFMRVNSNAIPNAGADINLSCIGGSAPSSVTTSPLPNGGVWTQVGTLPSIAQIDVNTISSLTEEGTYKFYYSLNNCVDTLNVTVPICAVDTFDLALKKTLSSAGPFTPGATVNFEIKIYNQGTIAATNVNVTDYIPTGLTLNNPGATWTTAIGGKTNLVTAIPTLAAGDSVVRTISFTIDANFQGTTLRNWAEISAATNALNQPDIDSDPDVTNFNQTGETNDLNDDNVISQNGKTGGDEDDHDPAEITVSQVFDLALKKTLSSAGPFTPGSTVNFEIKIYNQGTITATNVNVTDYIPTGLTLNNPGTTWTTASGGKTNLVIGVPILVPGDSIVRTISFTIDANFQGTTLRNWAEISSATNALNQPDIDSDPDATNFNQAGETNDLNDDNVISQNGKTGGDEDDHDPAEITVSQTFDLALKKNIKFSRTIYTGFNS